MLVPIDPLGVLLILVDVVSKARNVSEQLRFAKLVLPLSKSASAEP